MSATRALWLLTLAAFALTTACGGSDSDDSTATPAAGDDTVEYDYPDSPVTPAACLPVVQVVEQSSPTLIPDDIEISPDGGALWIASTLGNSLLAFDINDGSPIGEPLMKDIDRPWAMTYSPNGNLLVSELDEDQVWEYDINTGESFVRFSDISEPIELFVENDTSLIVAEGVGAPNFTGGWFTRLTLDGEGAETGREVISEDFGGALDLAIDNKDRWWITIGGDGTLYEAGSDAVVVNTYPDSFTSPSDILFHPHSAGLIVSAGPEVAVVNPDTGEKVSIACAGEAEINGAEDLAIAADGTIYVAEAAGLGVSRVEWTP